MTPLTQIDRAPAQGLARLPVALFSSVMGITGLALAWDKAHLAFGVPTVIGDGLALVGAGVFAVMAVLYLAKLVTRFDAVRSEWAHPVQSAFFGTVGVSLLLLSAASARYVPGLALYLWVAGAGFQLILSIALIHRWIARPHDLAMAAPPWFIPIVGNILAPIQGVALNVGDLIWLFFAIGVVFWLVLKVIVLHRLIFEAPLANELLPTLAILIAPPALTFNAYAVLVPGAGADAFARVALYTSIFMFLVLLSYAGRLVRMTFHISWWAYTFPLAALSTATCIYVGQVTRDPVVSAFSIGVLLLTTVLVGVVSVATARAVIQGTLLGPGRP